MKYIYITYKMNTCKIRTFTITNYNSFLNELQEKFNTRAEHLYYLDKEVNKYICIGNDKDLGIALEEAVLEITLQDIQKPPELPQVAQVPSKRELMDDERPSKRLKTGPELIDHWLSSLSLIEVHGPPELFPKNAQEFAGRFRKKEVNPEKLESLLPFSGSNFVDLRLSETSTDMSKELINLCKNNANMVHVLLAVSGAGKTRAIFDIAMQDSDVFLMYIECNPGRGDEDLTSVTRLEPTRDRNFAQLCHRISAVNLKVEEGQSEAARLIALEFTSRILYLILLKIKFPNLTPRGYLLSQLNRGQESISAIKRSLASESERDLCLLFEEAFTNLPRLLLGSQLVIAIDEANVGANLFFPNFRNRRDHLRGLLTPMLKFFDSYKITMVIAGTSLTLRHGVQILSDVAKRMTKEYMSNFETLTIDGVKRYIESYLDLSDCVFEEIKASKLLTGRPRLAARLILEIVQAEKNYGTFETKQVILERAVDQTVKAVYGRLKYGISELAEKYMDGDPEHQFMVDILEDLFICCRFFKGVAKLAAFDENSTYLVECGIGSLVQTRNGKFIRVEEPLAVKAVRTVLSLKFIRPKETLINNLFKKLVERAKVTSDTSKGKVWKYLLMGKLLDYNDMNVADIIKLFYNDNQILCRQRPDDENSDGENPDDDLEVAELPQWTKTAIFRVESFGDVDMLSQLCGTRFYDAIDVIAHWLQFPDKRRYILEPSNSMRPDGLHIGSFKGNITSFYYWTLLISAKFFDKPMSGKSIDTDKISTDWNVAYHTKNEESNETCSLKKEALNKARQTYFHCGSLRIHFVLPGLASSKDGSDRGGCRVEDDDVIMYIDKTMLGKLFGDDIVTRMGMLMSLHNS